MRSRLDDCNFFPIDRGVPASRIMCKVYSKLMVLEAQGLTKDSVVERSISSCETVGSNGAPCLRL